MRLDCSYRLAFLVAIFALIAAACYRFLPDRVITLYPGDRFATTNVYSDKQAGGISKASWVDAKRLHWRCDVRDAGVPRFCGLHIVFFPDAGSGWDLTHHSAVRLKLKAQTTDQRIRIIFRNFEEGFSTEGNISSAKYMNALIPQEYLHNAFTVGLDEFAVAEWWINQWKAPRDLVYPKFNDIRTMSIDLGSPAALGVHEFQLERLQFIGQWVSAQQWYLGVLAVSIGFFLMVSLYRYLQMRKHLAQERAQIAVLVRDMNELEYKSLHYRELSLLDKLTGTLNRHGLEQVIADIKSGPQQDKPVGLLIVDLDRFKEINDKHGHDIGDKVLATVARVLLDGVRLGDHVVRWGGEEFVIICPLVDEGGALALAEHLRVSVAAAKHEYLPGLQITASIGVGSFYTADEFEHAFKRVDSALYSAKNAGRDRVQCADAAA